VQGITEGNPSSPTNKKKSLAQMQGFVIQNSKLLFFQHGVQGITEGNPLHPSNNYSFKINLSLNN
jgi:hypothetical protein